MQNIFKKQKAKLIEFSYK